MIFKNKKVYFFVIYLILFFESLHSQEITSSNFILGKVDVLFSKILSENRVLNIYLPEGYNEKDTISYPVTFLLDGGFDEDFIHVVGIYQFNNFEWVNRTPKSIIVGIANSDRKRDFTFPTLVDQDLKKNPTCGKSENFIEFIEKELFSYIQKKYKTKKEFTLIGQSLGGLLATEILLKRPNLFTNFIIISPSLWWNNASLLNESTSSLDKKITSAKNIYIGVGKEGLTPSSPSRVMEVDANLLVEKLNTLANKKLNIYFDYLPNENHATVSHQAISNALLFFYNSKQNK